mgnify:CR=1 FL=1
MTEKPLFNPEGLFPSTPMQNEPSEGPLKLSQWSSTSGAELSDLDKVLGYSNYLRQHSLDQGTLDREAEIGITTATAQMLGRVDPTYKMSMDVGTTDTDAALIGQAFGEDAKNNFIESLDKGFTRNDFTEELNEAKQHLVENGTLKLASLKKKSAEGNNYFEVIGASNIVDKNKAVNDALNAGALRHRDMWQVPTGLEEFSAGVSRFKAITANKIRNEFAAASKSEENKDLYDEVRAEAKEHFSSEGNDPSALITKSRDLLSNIRSSDSGISNEAFRARFDDDDIMGVLEQLAVSDQYASGEAKFISDPEKLGDNIKVTSNGHAIAHLELILDKQKFEAALNQKELSDNQRDQLTNYRGWWFDAHYEGYNEMFSDSTVSDEWTEAKIQGATESKSNGQILEEFIGDDSNYSGFKNRLGLFVDSIKDSFTGLVAVAPALFGNKNAINYLSEQEQDRVNRREVAKVFGDEFGIAADVGSMIAPVLVDIGATAMLSAGTLGLGGLAYIGGKQGVRVTVKGLVTSMTGSILSKQFGETAADTAVRLSARKLIEISGKGGAKGTMEAIQAYNKLAATKFFRRGTQTPFLFATAANRSAGGTYATVYNNFEGTHDEKHDAALGAALRAGTATGLITSAFSFVGAGGLEDALLRGMTYSQKVFMLNRIGGSPITQLNVKKSNELIKAHIQGRLDKLSKTNFGDIYQRFLRAGTEEFVEEALDEFINQFIVDASLDRETPLIDKISGAMYAGLLGGIIGQGAAGARSIINKNNREAASIFMAQEEDALINALRESGSPLTANVLSNVSSSQLTQGELSELAVERQTRQLLRMPAGAELPTTGPAIEIAEKASLDEQGSINKTSAELKEERLNNLINPDPEVQQEAQDLVKQANNSEVQIDLEEELKSEDFQNFREEQAAKGTKEENIEEDNVLDPNVELQQEANRQIEENIEASSKIDPEVALSEEEQAKIQKKFQDNLSNMLNIVDRFGAKIEFDDNAKTSFAFNPSSQSIIINKGQVAGLIANLNARNGKALTKAILTEELIHKGSYNILTKSERKAVFDTLSKSEQNKLVDNYYRTPEDRAAAKQRLAENNTRERETVVEELMRMEAQKAMSGFTSEENYEFFSQNPSALRVFLRYLQNLVSRLRRYFEAEPDNPYLAATTNRVIRAYNAMKNGFEVTSLPAFSPDNPANTFELLASQIRTEGEKPFSDVEGINEVAGQRLVDAATNAEYLELAKDPKKNKQALQDMVDKAAIAAGYNSNEVYHGTPNEFTAFDYDKINSGTGFAFGLGFYFGGNRNMASGYALANGNIIPAYLKIENGIPHDTPALSSAELVPILQEIAEAELQELRVDNPEANEFETTLGDYGGIEAAADLIADGNDTIAEQTGELFNAGVSAKNVLEAFKKITGIDAFYSNARGEKAIIVVLTPEQIKLSDPVTYDAEGNIIPLAERFDETTDELVRSSIVSGVEYRVHDAQSLIDETFANNAIGIDRDPIDSGLRGSRVHEIAKLFDSLIKDEERIIWNESKEGTDKYAENVSRAGDRVANLLHRSMDEYPQFATWYEERIDMAMDIFEELDPDISKPENSFVLKILLAVTSNGAKVLTQTKDSWNIYKEWKKTGKLNNAVRSSGDRGDQVAKHLADTDNFIERVGWEKLKAFFDRSGTVAEVRDALVSDLGVDSEVAKDILKSKGELIDEVVPFSIFYGPKLGSFYHNLNGKFDSITMDRWFLRTFGKLTGTQLKKISRKVMAEKRDRFARAFRAYVASDPKGGLLSAAGLSTRLKDPKGETRDNVVAALVKYFAKKPNRSFYYDKKTGDRIPTDEKLIPKKAPKLADLRLAANGLKLYLDGVTVKDDPEGGGHRRFTRQAMLDGINKLEQRTGTKLVPAEAQALLWYYEKETHRLFGSAQERDPDYGSAANEVFRNERGEDAINFRPSIGNRRRSEQRTDDIGSDARVDRTGEDVLESDDEVIASQLSPDTASKKALARFGDLTGMLEVPQYYTGKYRGKFTGLKKWLNGVAGEADPRLRELYENEVNLRNAVGEQVDLWRNKLQELVLKAYPKGNPPIDLFRKITGDPEGMSLSRNTVGYINNLVGKAKRKVGLEKKKAQADLDSNDPLFQEAEQKYVNDLAVIDNYKTQLYNKAYAAQKKVMQREKNEAIEALGGFDSDGVPKGELAQHLFGLRAQIDEFSKAIRNLYPNDPDAHRDLRATIDRNLEVYLTRSYRLFTEAGFIRKVMYEPNYKSTRDNAVKFFEAQYIKERGRSLFKKEDVATLQQAEEQALQELRDSPTNPDSGLTEITHGLMIEFLNMYSPKSNGWLQVKPQMTFRGGKSFGTVLADKLKDRKNIPKELKALMGEEVDATGYDAALRTYMHVGIMASHQAFLRNLVQVGREGKEGEKWLLTASEVQKEPNAKDYEMIDLRSDKAFNPFIIDGQTLYAHKDLIESVRAMGASTDYVLNETDKAASYINRTIGVMTGSAMAAKTLGSVGFYMRNALGNVLYFGLSQGNLPTLSMGKTFVKEIGRKKLFFLRGKLNREAVQAYYSELKALGVIGDELRPKMLEELFSGEKTPAQMMEEATGIVEEIGKLDSIKNKTKSVRKTIDGLYSNLKDLSAAMDTFYKIDYFERELKTIKKAVAAAKSNDTEYYQLSEYQMQRKAARIVKRTAQSFSQAMPFIKGFAKSSVGQMFAPFVRFKGEVARITVNTTVQAFQELAHPNSVIKLRGARRLAGQTAVMGGISAMVPVLLRLAQNITDEEDEALRATTVSYLKNHTFFIAKGFIPKVQDENKLYTWDFTYLNPFSLVVDPFIRSFEKIAQGKDTGEVMKVFAESLIFDQYLDEQIFAGALLALRKNKDPETGRAIWGTQEDSFDQFYKMGMFLWEEAFQPKVIQTGREVAKGLTVDKEKALEQALLRIAEEFLPLKPYELDLRTNLSRYMNSIRMETQIASRGKNKAFFADKMSKQDVFDIVDTELEYKKNIDRQAYKVFNGIMELSKKTDTPITEDELRKLALANQIGKRRFSLIMRGMTETPRKANIDFQKRLRAKMQEDPKFVERADQFNEAYKSYPRYLFH